MSSSRHAAMLREGRLHCEPLEDRLLPSGAPFQEMPIIPRIDASMQIHLRAVLEQGTQFGNRTNAFAKVGDSITNVSSFLSVLGSPAYDPSNPYFVGTHSDLAKTVDFFRSRTIDESGANSFDHVSWAAQGGWSTRDVLNPALNFDPARAAVALLGESPLESELRLTRPAFALVMLGTNDLRTGTAASLRANLLAIGETLLDRGTVPIFSTIPDIFLELNRLGPLVSQYNQAIVDVADSLNVPLMNYWLSMQLLHDNGLSIDGVHPSTPGEENAGFFTDDGLEYGFNVRNLIALEALDKVRRVVLEDGRPDTTPIPIPGANETQFVQGLYEDLLGRSATPPEVQYWSAFLLGGIPKRQVARKIARSIEALLREVEQDYQKYLKHAGDEAGRSYWATLRFYGATSEDVAKGFLTSPEYSKTHATDAAFVDGLYDDLLNGATDESGKAYWMAHLAQGRTRAQIVDGWFQASGVRQQTLADYFGQFLDRELDEKDKRLWQFTLESSTYASESVLLTILASEEFTNRGQRSVFGPIQ